MTISINSNFKKTILGDIVFKFNENESIAFFEDEKDFSKGMNKRIPVNDIVDVKTFRRVKSEYNITIYEDSLHIYELHNGDDVFMLFLEKNKK